ncbi:rhodanese-like domain-containing protein [Bacillus sp. DJP31]|uniref:rhodanese-like domain-containing protein n=1 Tax=Bacillus sp. DJP31 TaxID=3409789 RepID=UPI003BB6CA1C
MDYLNYILLALVMFFIIKRILPVKGVRQITTVELKKELDDINKQYIDVRTNGEFRANNIKGFKNFPLHELSQKMKDLSKDKEIFVICQSGMRSNKASKLFIKHGFKKVTNIKGGMSSWT